MKKTAFFFLMFIFAFVLTACGPETTTTSVATTEPLPTTTTLPALDVPAGLSIADNVVTYGAVTGAAKYKLRVSDGEGNVIGEYNVPNGFNLFTVLPEGTYGFQIKATGTGYADSPYSELLTAAITDPDKTAVLEGETLNDFTKIRWLGRTWYDASRSVKCFFFTASGFEVTFHGTELKAVFGSTYFSNASRQAYLIVLLDGEEDPTKGRTLILDKEEAEYTLASGLEDGVHTVKVLKRSEASDSDTWVKSITTDGWIGAAPEAEDFRIQVIAASSSTGYGNLGNLAVPKSTANSNGMLGFAYLTAYVLAADIDIFSASGWGVTRGWNTGGALSALQNIPAAYDYFAIDDSNTVFTTPGKWDPSDYEPDVIVVNLGTNDFNATGYTGLTEEAKAEIARLYTEGYTAFLLRLYNMHRSAKIIVAYGLMGETSILGQFTLDAIAEAEKTIGTGIISTFVMEAGGTNGNLYGSNYHPNVQTSINNAEDLAALISTLTGRQIVRDMIDWN